eukprot:scaffold108_cov162-Amphora_coffeaeformis.AAC.5
MTISQKVAEILTQKKRRETVSCSNTPFLRIESTGICQRGVGGALLRDAKGDFMRDMCVMCDV